MCFHLLKRRETREASRKKMAKKPAVFFPRLDIKTIAASLVFQDFLVYTPECTGVNIIGQKIGQRISLVLVKANVSFFVVLKDVYLHFARQLGFRSILS